MQFFSSDKRLQEFFFKITHPAPTLPQEFNGRPLSKTTTDIRPCITHFLYISFSFLHAYHVLMPNFAFFWRASTSNYEILFLLLIFDMVPWNSTSGEFAFIWQSKWVGIIAIKTGRTQIYFRNDVLVDVASWLRARRIGKRVKVSSTANFDISHLPFWHEKRFFC